MAPLSSAFVRGLRSAAKRIRCAEQPPSAGFHTFADALTQVGAPTGAAASRFAIASVGPSNLWSLARIGASSVGSLRQAHGCSPATLAPAGGGQEDVDLDLRHANITFEDVEVGKVYEGRVVNLANFGCFVNFGCEMDCLVHISQMSDSFVRDVADVVSVGTEVRVKILSKDEDRRRISGSFKSAESESRGYYA